MTNGVFEATFPSGFTLTATSGDQIVSGLTVQKSGQTYVAGQDYAVTIIGVTNPGTSAGYGPFALRTRYYSGGQQVDVNLTFGNVFIYGDAGTLGTFTVSVVGAASTGTIINRSGNSLSFKFAIAVSLWKYDTFVITTDYRWTIASGATCSSADYAGRWNNFNGTNVANPHSLQCVITPQTAGNGQTVYIYGLAVDGIDVTETTDNLYVDLRVTSVTSPNSVYTGNPYSWKVSTTRFGTTTNLETADYTLGPAVTSDSITVATWVPTWGAPASSLRNGQAAFMDLTFTLTNAIPYSTTTLFNGYITVTVSESLANDANWMTTNCYLVTYLGRAVDCTLSSSTITISGLMSVAAGTQIKLRSVVTINSVAAATAQITSIQSFQGVSGSPTTAGYPIDVGSSLGAFTVASDSNYKSATLTITQHKYATALAITTAGGSIAVPGGSTTPTPEDINLQFIISSTDTTAFTSSTQFTISCPFTSAVDDFSFAVPAPGWGFSSDTVSTAFGYGAGFNVAYSSSPGLPTGATSPIFSAGTSGTSLGSITFSGNIIGTSGSWSTKHHLLVSTASGTTYIQNPRIVTNYATAYECRLAIATSTQPTQTAFTRFLITVQPWNDATFTVPCTDLVAGVPGMFGIRANLPLLPSSSSQNYYVEVEFGIITLASNSGLAPQSITAALATSRIHDPLANAVDYPFDKSGSVPSSCKMYASSSTTTFALGGFGSLTPTNVAANTLYFYLPLGVATTGAHSATIRSVYYLTSDPRYSFVTHSGSSSVSISAVQAANWGAISPVSSSNAGTNGNAHTGLTLEIFKSDIVVGSETYNYFIFPVGVTFPGTRAVKNIVAGVTFGKAFWFSSTLPTFAFPGVLFSNSVSGVTTTSFATSATSPVTGTMQITGFSLPLGVSAAQNIYAASGITTGGSVCRAYGSLSFTYNAGAINVISISPNTVKVRQPDGINISHTVSFSTTHLIPKNGSVVMTIDFSNWGHPGLGPLCTGCTVTGFTASSTNSLLCDLTSTAATVSGFAEVSAATTLTIKVFGILAPSTSSTTAIPFTTSIVSKTVAGLTIDSVTGPLLSGVTVTAGSSQGSPTWIARTTYPNTVGLTYVDLYLKFSMPHALPACGVIAITSPLQIKQSADVKNSCFFSPLLYSACTVNGSTISLSLAQNYAAGTALELYLDAMVDNPTTTAATTTGFMLSASWGATVTDFDATGTAQSTQTYTATAAPTATLAGMTTNSLTFSPKTAGEVATYVFDFKDTAPYAVGEQYWIVFPSQYDYFLGDTWAWYINELNVYYIECSSTQLGVTMWCQVDHNIVIVSGSQAVTGGGEIILSINGVTNPAAGQTNAFQIYHVSATGAYLSLTMTYGTVTPLAPATSNIAIRSLTMTDNRLFKSSDYAWRIYITDAMNTDSQLQLLYPKEYDLNKFDRKDSYNCATTWQNFDTTATIKTQQNWNAGTSCANTGNLVVLAPPTTAITFTANHLIRFSLTAVATPQYSLKRESQGITTDFDMTDNVLWPLWTYWASKFTFFVYRTNVVNLFYSSRSYPNMHASYANFYQQYRPLVVNSYEPQSKANRILVFAGTQTTDLFLTTASRSLPMAAKNIAFTPVTNPRTPDGGKLKYTSVISNWILFQSFYSMQFRVAAAVDMPKGLYYIDWTIKEEQQTGVPDIQYDIPPSTLVEVAAKVAGKYNFAISSIPDVALGYSSVPVKVTITNSPHTDVTVDITVSGSPANISVTPKALTFAPDTNVLYFQVSVDKSYDVTLGSVVTLLYTVSGTDAFAFAVTPSMKFTVTQPNPNTSGTPGNIVTWGVGTPTKTTCPVSPTSDQIGIIYYQLSTKGTFVPDYATLKSSITSLVSLNGTNTDPSTQEDVTSEADPQSGETWVQFQHRLFTKHMETKWLGSISMYSTTGAQSILFNWLWAGISYQIAGYLDNLGPTNSTPTARIEYFTTSPMAESQDFAVKFQGLVAASYDGTIAYNMAWTFGVNPLRVGNATYGTVISRRLQSILTVAYTTFTYTLLVNRFSESPDPSQQVQVSGTAYTTLAKKFLSDGITNTLNSITPLAVHTRTTPTWIASPTSGGATLDSVKVLLRANVAGLSCCVALSGTTIAPTSEQVVLGLDFANVQASNLCITNDLTTSNNEVKITNLQSSTSYYVYCTAVDTYPLWPTHMAFTANNPMVPVAITTLTQTNTTISGASYLGGLLALLALLLH